jgi:uncharacterized protein YerC
MTHGGQLFHNARIKSGVRVETLGHETGLSTRTILRYEDVDDWGRVPYATVVKLAHLVGLEPADLIADKREAA